MKQMPLIFFFRQRGTKTLEKEILLKPTWEINTSYMHTHTKKEKPVLSNDRKPVLCQRVNHLVDFPSRKT